MGKYIRKEIYVSTSSMSRVEIPFERLRTLLKTEDIIYGMETKIRIGADFVEYRVTFIDHWGVYAVPTESMRARLEKSYDKVYFKSMNGFKAHIKFKWCNIYGVKFIKEI